MKFPQNVTESIFAVWFLFALHVRHFGEYTHIVSMVTANVICRRLTAAAQNTTTHPGPAPNLKSFLLRREPKHKWNGGGGGDGETRRAFYTIIKKLGALAIRFTFFRGGVEKSFKIIFISLGLGQVLKQWALKLGFFDDSINGKTLHWHSR